MIHARCDTLYLFQNLYFKTISPTYYIPNSAEPNADTHTHKVVNY